VKKSFITLIVLAAFLALLALGCGGSEKASTTSAATAPPTSQSETSTTASVSSTATTAEPTTVTQAAAEEVALFPASSGGKTGYIDSKGKWIIPPKFFSAYSFSEGLAVATTDEYDRKYGYIDAAGSWVIEPQFVNCLDFSEGLAAVQMEEHGFWGYIDRAGTLVIPPKFQLTQSVPSTELAFSDGLARFTKNGGSLWGYFDKNGNEVIKPQFDTASLFSEGFAAVKVGEKSYFIDQTGQPAFGSPDYAAAGPFAEGLAPVAIKDAGGTKYGFIDTTGTIVIQPQFDWVGRFSEGLAMFGVGDKSAADATYGFIGTRGQVVIQPQYDYAYSNEPKAALPDDLNFSEGLALVTSDHGESWAYIDQTGAVVIQPQELLMASPFRNGLARLTFGDLFVSSEWRSVYIDKSGNTVWEKGS
jgi:hypothetical protein